MATTSAHLKVVDSRTDKEYEVPIHDNYIKAKDLSDITVSDGDVPRKLLILDNGFESTACMHSSITHIDGLRGEVRYRGLPIQDLFRDHDFEDVLHLLLWSRLPNDSERRAVRASVNAASVPPASVINTIAAFSHDAEPYPMIIAGMSAFVAADEVAAGVRHQHKAIYREDGLKVADESILRTIGYYSAILALVHCHKRKRAFTPPRPEGSLVGNMLLMMGIHDASSATPKPDPKIEACLSKLWILYADHEMTNSTAGILNSASTLTDPTSCIMAGLICGYGPLHGGAIELAYAALEKIGHPRNVPIYIEMIKKKKARLFGYGHRIYKTRDPRLALIEELIEENKEAVAADPLLKVAFAIDRIANEDEYFVSRNLKANADLLGCFLYSALGFERDMIVGIICLSRVVGGLAHWRETLTQPIKLWRPLQIYSGPKFAPGDGADESMSSGGLHDKDATTTAVTPGGHGKGKSRKSIVAMANQLWVKAAVAMIRT